MPVWGLGGSILFMLPVLLFGVWAVHVACSSGPPPAPDLLPVPGCGSGMTLRCRAPHGHLSLHFRLYRVHELVDSVSYETPQPQAEFVLQGGTVEPGSLYCCQYGNSMFSIYTRIKAPPCPIMPPGPPHLSVTPPAGRVLPGQVLEFQCQTPPSVPAPVAFLLLRQLAGPQDPAAQQRHVVGQSASPRFQVGPVGQGEEGIYTCLYRIDMQEGVQDSVPSSPVSIILAAHLPVPQLSQEKEGVLVCMGSPSYPGAIFSLFPQGTPSPVATLTAPVIKHSAQFSMPDLQRERGVYQCQYSVLLGKDWAHSERSAPLTVSCTTGSPSYGIFPKDKTHRHTGRAHLALVIGSISAALLFLLVLIILGFTMYKHAKAAAMKHQQREPDLFCLHSENHTVDLTLRPLSINTMGFGSENGRCSVSEPIYDYPLSTFTKPQYN
ncbi:uncharacterized protein LOC113588791 isoform X3 [Electrophorus electricus]|uniref:uncharacterized protein LOC113588791 isoform X3 n=1 Tax=Electrophorus electricus TaxID=8005 RepID=UPI0015D00F7E|nr:uncharacterized protein LOC113588791 isoform X3 [Electrophorus electricus]